MIIDKPGVYPALPASDYHSGDVTPEPALSSSVAWKMITECPAKIWQDHPALNPGFKPKTARAFDIGTACHSLVLEGDATNFVIVRGYTKDGKPSKGYTTDDAKAQRDAAYEAGKVPLLPDELPLVEQMATELRAQLDADPENAMLLLPGEATTEASYFWQDRRTGLWCKSRPDWYANGELVNYKTSGRDVGPARDYGKHIADLGYAQRAAWEIEAIRAVTGKQVRKDLIVAQEDEAPHVAVVYELQESDLEYGAMLNRYAIQDFAECLARGKTRECWPGYREPDRLNHGGRVPLPLPGYFQMALEEYRVARQETDQRKIKINPAVIRAAQEAQRPLEA